MLSRQAWKGTRQRSRGTSLAHMPRDRRRTDDDDYWDELENDAKHVTSETERARPADHSRGGRPGESLPVEESVLEDGNVREAGNDDDDWLGDGLSGLGDGLGKSSEDASDSSDGTDDDDSDALMRGGTRFKALVCDSDSDDDEEEVRDEKATATQLESRSGPQAQSPNPTTTRPPPRLNARAVLPPCLVCFAEMDDENTDVLLSLSCGHGACANCVAAWAHARLDDGAPALAASALAKAAARGLTRSTAADSTAAAVVRSIGVGTGVFFLWSQRNRSYPLHLCLGQDLGRL